MINNLPNFDSSEKEILNDFSMRIAQMGTDEEIMGGETPEDMAPLQEDTNDMGDEAMLDTEAEGDELTDILDSPDKKKIEPLNWDNVTVVMNEDYGTMLAEEQGLDLQDALDKAHYIRYKNPDELLALQGTLFGKNADDGEGLIELGGYDTQENLENQLEMLRSDEYFEGGIPEDLKDELLIPLDELSSSFEDYKDSKDDDKAERKIDELSNPAEVEKDEEDMLELPEAAAPEVTPTTEAPKGAKMSPTIPRPLGKASINYVNKIIRKSIKLDSSK